MRVLILGANGMMGPWVSKLLNKNHEIIETDLVKIDSNINFYKIDISNLNEVLEISQNVDAIINLSVYRNNRDLAFNVNTLGTYNMMKAAEEHKIPRIINTGPHFVLAGPSFETYDFNINSDIPNQPGVNIYALTKSLGNEICKIFADNNDFIYVQTLLFYHLYSEELILGGSHQINKFDKLRESLNSFSVTWEDAAMAIKLALEIELEKLDSRAETYFISEDLPHRKFMNSKAKNKLGWIPRNKLKSLWSYDE